MDVADALPFFAILAAQSFAFYRFYRHPHGQPAVYAAPYAWIIDLLAIAGGGAIMYIGAYAIVNPDIFTLDVHDGLLWAMFFVGSWQAGIHGVKWLIRYLHH